MRRARTSPEVAVGAAAAALYIGLAAAGVSWGDSGDLTAAAHALGVSHPPGHPGHALTGKLAALLVPVGEIGFRVALVSAAAMGFALAGVVALARRLVPARDDDVGLDAGLVGAGLAAAAPLVLDVATRAAVFAPAAALIVWSLVAVVEFLRPRPGMDKNPAERDGDAAAANAALPNAAPPNAAPPNAAPPNAAARAPARLGPSRLVLMAALGCGLAAGFHPSVAAAAALVMSAAVTMASLRTARRRLARVLPAGLGLALLGLATCAYLPTRSAAALPPLLSPADAGSARGVWQLVTGPLLAPEGWDLGAVERFAELALGAGQSTGLGLLLGGTVGLALTALTRLRGAGTALAVAAATLAAAALVDPRDPDRAGLVLPALLILAAGLAPLCAALVRLLPADLGGRGMRARRAVVALLLVPVMAVGLIGTRGPAVDRGDDPARLWADTAGRVPPGPGLYFAGGPHSLFAGSYEQVVAGGRPDLALASEDLAADRRFLRRLKHARPELYVPLVDDTVAGNLAERLAVSNLRRGRPVAGDEPGFGRLMTSHARPIGRAFQYLLERGDAAAGEAARPPPDFRGATGEAIARLIGLTRADYEAERGRLAAAALAAGLAPHLGRERMEELARSRPRSDRPPLLPLLPRMTAAGLAGPWLTELLADDLAWRAGLEVAAPPADAPPERILHARWRALLTGALAPGSAALLDLGPAAASATTRLLASMGNDESVEKHVRALIERTPRDAASLAILASVLFRRGDAPGAEAMFRRSIAIASRVAETHARLSEVLAAQGKGDEARAEWERAVALDPSLANSPRKPSF